MTTKLFFLMLGCCWLGRMTDAWAQADFRPGYILPLSGDTVRGLADYRGNVRNAELCRFRPAAGAEIASYTPMQLRGYGFESGRHYQTQLLAAIDSVQYQATLPPRPVFMERLATGALNLYQIRSSSTGVDRFFVASAGQAATMAITELLPRRSDDTDTKTLAYRKANLYRGVLTERMTDCPDVRMQVATVPFTTSALVGVVQRYNACRMPVDGATTNKPARPGANAGSRLQLGVVAGAALSQLTVTGASVLTNGHFVSSPLPVVGLGLTIPFASISEKLSLRIEALVEHQRYADTFPTSVGFSGAYEQVRLNLTYVRVPLLLRYTYPAGKLRPFAQAGVCYAQRLNFDTAVQSGRISSSGTIQYDTAQPLESLTGSVVNYEIGLVGSLGVHLPAVAGRALTLELRTESSSGLIATTGIKSSQQRYFALLAYNFKK